MKLTVEQQYLVETNHKLIYWYINLKHLNITEWYDLLAIELCHTIIRYNPEKGSLCNYYKRRCDNLVKREYTRTQLKKNKSPQSLTFVDDIIGTDEYSDIDERIEIEKLLNSEHGEMLRLRAMGYTQDEMSDILGVSQSYISKIINKKKEKYYNND